MRSRVLSALLLACIAQTSMAWQEPWVQPHDARQAAANSDEYAWRLFVALNWPAETAGRAADPSAPLGADRPVVWETWQSVADVFPADGRDPGPWVVDRAQPALANERRFETGSLKDLARPMHIIGGRMVPLLDPMADAKRLTEIRMNETAFDYIRARELYNERGQLRAAASDRGVHFPLGSTNIKAKWRPITEAEHSRYHTLVVTLSDGSRHLYGLTALHVAVKDLDHWLWATFEHVDNRSLAGGEGWRLPSRDAFACGRRPVDCNQAPRGIGLENTVWQYYRLRGTLTRFVDPQSRPLLLANSELEAGMQSSSSCITCHSRAAIGTVAGAPARLPIFDAVENDSPTRHGYVGTPSPEWFAGSGGGARPGFEQLDFVWSLSKAAP
jgi:hypothetical protein